MKIKDLAVIPRVVYRSGMLGIHDLIALTLLSLARARYHPCTAHMLRHESRTTAVLGQYEFLLIMSSTCKIQHHMFLYTSW